MLGLSAVAQIQHHTLLPPPPYRTKSILYLQCCDPKRHLPYWSFACAFFVQEDLYSIVSRIPGARVVGGVTAGQVGHNSSNVAVVTVGQVGHSSSY